MDERFRAEPPAPCRVSIDHLTPHQVILLRTLLRSGEVPYGIVRGEIVAGAEWADEVEKAVAWASVDPSGEADEFDDPEYRSDKRPLVKPPRPPLRDGRHQVTRLRRLSAGVVDEVLIGVPTLLAHRAGAAPWTGAVVHAIYYVVPSTWFGWSIGKLWTGVRVVDRTTLRPPSPTRSFVRWLVSAVPMLAALFAGLNGNAMTVAVFAVYVPIVVDLRGAHDYAAGTVVAERTTAGPGIWVRQRSAVKNG
jgi:uncharacterized RDD family membrane protein YckC